MRVKQTYTKQEISNMRKENQRLMHNLKRRIKRIGNSYVQGLKAYKDVKWTTRGLSPEELRRNQRRLEYLNSLKTTTVKGFKQFKEEWSDIMNSLDKEQQNEFFEIYNKIIEENALFEKFKYEMLSTYAKYKKWFNGDKDTLHRALFEKANDMYQSMITQNTNVDEDEL